jgi:hypothetical protein
MSKADVYQAVRNADSDKDAGSVVRCCTCFTPFYGAGARADTRIQTFSPGSESLPSSRVPYRLKTLKCKKDDQILKGRRESVKFYQKTIVKFF